MSNSCFVSQAATEEILLRVTNMCGECYSDILVDDIIHYDMQNYHRLHLSSMHYDSVGSDCHGKCWCLFIKCCDITNMYTYYHTYDTRVGFLF